MEEGQLEISMVFKALSRPIMFMGVDYNYFFIYGMFIMLVFIYSSNFIAFILIFPLHLSGWILSKIDPHIFKLLSVRATIGVVKNKFVWKCQSYEFY